MTIKLKTYLLAIVLGGLLSACATPPKEARSPTRESSLASALYTSELEYLDREMANDAYGMARAAKTRLELIERIGDETHLDNDIQDEFRLSRLNASLLASVRDMVASAKITAADNPDALARIDRLFPSTQAAQSGWLGGFNGLTGGRREVKVTIGLEIDATLAPNAEESVRLPVNSSSGTTIYVQSVGHHLVETTAALIMHVSRRPGGSDEWEPVECPETSAARLPCYVPIGDHSEIEISLKNLSKTKAEIQIFVSGNAESVAASLTAE